MSSVDQADPLSVKIQSYLFYLQETEIKCSVRPALSMTVSESLDSQIPAPIQEEYASDPEDAVLSSNELKSISVSGDEQASVDDVEGLDDNTEVGLQN